MLAFVKTQNACLCGGLLGSQHFSYIWRCPEHRLKQASFVSVLPVPMLESLSSLFFRTLCNKQSLLSLPARPLSQKTLPQLARLWSLVPEIPGQWYRETCRCMDLHGGLMRQ